MQALTIFTPTYNRASLLERCYRSLQRQTNKDFVWFVIDDGSFDNTNEVVDNWIKTENRFHICYYRKENGGLHTAYNLAIEHLETELAVCIDSDDYLPDNAVELILDFWRKNGSSQYAGITALDFDVKSDKNIGGYYPENQKSINLIDVLVGRYPSVYGDKKHVVRTELYKQVAPMGAFEGEKNFNPHYLHLKISENYDFLIMNENICYVDYQETGMTNSMYWQYYNSPNSFAEIRLLYLSFPDLPLRFKLRSCIHYDSSCVLAKRKGFVLNCPCPVTAALCLPAGFLLSRWILYQNRRMREA